MPAWLRVILIIVLIGALLCATAAVIGYRWFMNNKDRLLASAKHSQHDGEVFGQGKEATACIDEALAQVHACSGFSCELKARLFLDGCLRTATTTHSFCESVPGKTEFIKRAEWTFEQCTRRGMGADQRCTRVMQGVGTACDREASK